jgi:hypothetical protein
MALLCNSMAKPQITESLKHSLFVSEASGRINVPTSFRVAAQQLSKDCVVEGSFPLSLPNPHKERDDT